MSLLRIPATRAAVGVGGVGNFGSNHRIPFAHPRRRVGSHLLVYCWQFCYLTSPVVAPVLICWEFASRLLSYVRRLSFAAARIVAIAPTLPPSRA